MLEIDLKKSRNKEKEYTTYDIASGRNFTPKEDYRVSFAEFLGDAVICSLNDL